jgi:hypothetical protein
MSDCILRFTDTAPHNIVFMDRTGRPVLTIDGDRRRIDVPEDVDVTDAALAVLEMLRQLVGWLPK